MGRSAFITFIRDDIPIFARAWSESSPTQKVSIRLSLFLYVFVPYAKFVFTDHPKTLQVFTDHVAPFLYGLAEALLAVGFVIFILRTNRRHALLRIMRRQRR
jgi:hypothetical protein